MNRVVGILILLLANDAAAQDVDPADESYFMRKMLQRRGGTYDTIGPDWIVTCWPKVVNDLGEVETEANCRLEKHRSAALVMISKRGETLFSIPRDPLCKNNQTKLAVDKKPVHELSHKAAIQHMKTGKVYARQTERRWPYCTLGVESLSLKNFGTAYQLLQLRWRQRSQR